MTNKLLLYLAAIVARSLMQRIIMQGSYYMYYGYELNQSVTGTATKLNVLAPFLLVVHC